MRDPSGSGIGIDTDYLREGAPFDNYLIPGIVLFIVIGMFSLAVAFLTWKQKRGYARMIQFQGCMITGWILVQLTMVKVFHPLHAIIGMIGVVLMGVGRKLEVRN